MAHQSSTRYVGEYVVGRQIGSGSFSVVWHARHRVHGTEVAIKEIVTGRLNKKLQESLMSEIETGRIHLVLEFCRGGDLSMYIQQRQGRVPEATAKYFMHQLAAGLQILRDNNLIHRDLKPQVGYDTPCLPGKNAMGQFLYPELELTRDLTEEWKKERKGHKFNVMEGFCQLLLRKGNGEKNGGNLLLFTNSDNAVLKIADFGFARSLQPRGLAETLCGSPLYMAPEIMQLQKYDAKADLWSVGAILFQLVTGKTPFTGSNQIQLLQNIVKSTELQFPPDRRNLSSECIDLCRKLLRRNPVERLTFEEFFNHPFLSQRQSNELLRNRRSPKTIVGFPFSERSPVRNAEEGSQEDNLPFSLDDVSNGPDRSPSFVRKPSMKSTVGFSVGDRKEVSTTSNNMDLSSKFSSVAHKPENTSLRLDSRIPSEGNLKESFKSADRRPMDTDPRVVDSLELFDQEYVIVSGPPMDVSSSSPSASKLSHLPCNSGSPQQEFANMNSAPSAPMPIIGATGSRFGYSGSLDSHSSAPSGTSQGSMEIGDALEQPSPHCITRIKSLKRCASAVTELVNEKIMKLVLFCEKMESGRQLEAFSIQLVTLAIWKQALHICHTQAIEGSPTQEMARLRESPNQEHGSPDIASTHGPQELCSRIEREFLNEVGNAEELAKLIEPGNTEMPDAMETIYQSALALGRHGAVSTCFISWTTNDTELLVLKFEYDQSFHGNHEILTSQFYLEITLESTYWAARPIFEKGKSKVDEYMGDTENAAVHYSKAVRLLVFLLVEAPSLILNPPFSLTNSDRYRLRNYIDVLNNRQSHSRSQRMALLQAILLGDREML
ncbi:hypothetical protein RHGRI_015305 [Rhododendron griersonianum]|uniref:Protein kinase domain-containing protein n=1 Tax=Rhododendron griersonianum TaxID=479676 RepID=A0AAV6KD88_9ERIC|nr:hypothetical protein RHGRI_015305 [Rhododendron griersonianum]